jgi:hypothetical protein
MGWGLAVVEERTAAAAAAARTGSEVQRRRNGCWKQNMGLAVKTASRKGRNAAADPAWGDLRKKAHLTRSLCSSLCDTYTHNGT